MALPLPNTTEVQIVRLTKALYNAAPGNTYLTAFTESAGTTDAGMTTFANWFAAQVSTDAATLATTVVTNIGLTGAAATAGTAYLTARFNANPSNLGREILDAMNALATLTSDATYGTAASTFNDSIATSYAYSIDTDNTSTNIATLQAADEPVATGTGQTFTLTTGVDSGVAFTGTSGNDTYIADNTGTNVTGLADSLNGGAGTDTITIYGFTTGDGVPQMTGIENIVLDNSVAGATISLVNATGATSVTVQNALGATDTTVASGVGVTLITNADAATAQVVDYGATATSATLTLNGVTTNTTVDVEAQGAAVTTLNIATTGAASTVGQLEVAAAMATVVITGDKNLTITDAVEEAVEVINASALTGKLSVSTANQATTPDALSGTVDITDITVTGGSGDDTINIAANGADNEVSVNAGAGNDKVVIATAVAFTAASSTLAGDSIVGGDGTDTLSINGDVSAADLSALITGFETLEFTADAAGTAMTTNKLGITNFVLTGADTDVVLTGVGANATVTIGEANDSDITATIGTDTTADVINVAMESAGATSGSTITLTSYDTLNLSSTKATADAATVANTVAAIASTDTSALNISGTQDLTITTAALKASAAVASTSTGAVTSTFTTSVKSYSGGTGADTLTVVAGDLKQGNTFAGGAGTDKLTQSATSAQDAGILGLTGFETLALTTHATAGDAYKADFRNVTDLATLTMTAGDAADTLTLNRLSGDTTLTFNSAFGATVTTLNTGTSQKIGFSETGTVASLTLDSGATSVSIATASTKTGTITTLSGTSLETITVTGAGATTITTAVGTTVTKIDASAATGALTVTASATATTILGSSAADTITGGGAADTITGGDGIDTLSGGAGADTYVFAATGALNDADVLTIVAAADVLKFTNFLTTAGSLDQNGAAGTGINEYTSASVSDVAIANKVVMYSDADETLIDGADEIALLIQGAGDAFSLASGGKAIMVTGDAGASVGDETRIWYIDDSLDGVLGTVGTSDVVLVGITAGDFDVDTLISTQFSFA